MLAVLALTFSLQADTTLLRILAINDFHGALEPRVVGWSRGRPVGGLPALKAMMDSLAAECRCAVLRLDGGDQMQGTLISNLVKGRSAIEGLTLLGLSAATLGNHDLDWGVSLFEERMADAGYPWLVANLVDSTTGERPRWARPYAIVPAGPYRVAVIGYVTPRTKHIVFADRVAGLEFRGGRASFADVLQRIRQDRPDLTILLAHEGAFCDRSVCRGPIVDVASELDSTEVQLIVAGHTHTRIVTRVRGIPIVSAQANGTLIGIADWVDSSGSRTWRVRTDTVFADRVRPDTAAERLVAPYRPEAERLAGRVIATLGDSLLTRADEHPLGNLIADAQRAATRADFAVTNRGGVRRELYPGPITYGQLFELQPFGNTLVRMTVTGHVLRTVLERALSGSRTDLFVSGLVVRYDPRKPAGGRVVELRRSDGRPVLAARRYTLGLSDYLAEGGNGYTMLVGLSRVPLGMVDLDALIEWIERRPELVRAPRGRRLIAVTR